MRDMRITWCLLFALVAFAGNSVIARVALGGEDIDAAAFTLIRLASGAAALFFLSLPMRRAGDTVAGGDWTSAVMLFLYAIAFSYAYLDLAASTGALILFGAVQVTMIVGGIWYGERPRSLNWLGVAVAMSGLTLLVLPGLQAPSLTGSLLMALAGVSWGLYSLRGRGAGRPLAVTAGNFLRAAPLAVIAAGIAMAGNLQISWRGVLLAVLAGAVTSGVGYAAWYYALRGISAAQAATVQLSVPILAAVGGTLFLSERPTVHTAVSAAVILGGIGLSLLGRTEPLTGERTVRG